MNATAAYQPLYEQCRRSHVRPTPAAPTSTARGLGEVICSILTSAKAAR